MKARGTKRSTKRGALPRYCATPSATLATLRETAQRFGIELRDAKRASIALHVGQARLHDLAARRALARFIKALSCGGQQVLSADPTQLRRLRRYEEAVDVMTTRFERIRKKLY